LQFISTHGFSQSTFNQSLQASDGVHLPASLKSLQLSDKYQQPLTGIQFPNLQLSEIIIGYPLRPYEVIPSRDPRDQCQMHSYEGIKWPRSLQQLIIERPSNQIGKSDFSA